MNAEDFKRECRNIKMTQTQKERIWRTAVRRASSKERKTEGSMGRRRVRASSILFCTTGAAVALLLTFCLLLPGIWQNRSDRHAVLGTGAVEEAGEKAKPGVGANAQQNTGTGGSVQKYEYQTYLLLGTDSRETEFDQEDGLCRSDAILAVSVCKEAGTLRLLSIPPDTVLAEKDGNIPLQKLADVTMQEQGLEKMEAAVEELFGLSIDGTAAISFGGFAALVNQMGGLELEVTQEELSGERNELNGYLNEIVLSTGIATTGPVEVAGLQWMDGPKVLAWCRVNPDRETGRGGRFLEVAQKLADKVVSGAYPLHDLIALIPTLDRMVDSNMDLAEILRLSMDVVSGPEIETENLAEIAPFIPDTDVPYRLYQDTLYRVSDWESVKEAAAKYLYAQ